MCLARAATIVNECTRKLKFHTNTDVEPIRVARSEFLKGGSLDDVGPFGNIELASLLEISGVGLRGTKDLY